jgi:hypothetical protein
LRNFASSQSSLNNTGARKRPAVAAFANTPDRAYLVLFPLEEIYDLSIEYCYPNWDSVVFAAKPTYRWSISFSLMDTP